MDVSSRPASKVVKGVALQVLIEGPVAFGDLVARVQRDRPNTSRDTIAREVRRARVELVAEGRVEILADSRLALVAGSEGSASAPLVSGEGTPAGSRGEPFSPRGPRALLGKSKNVNEQEAAAASGGGRAPRGELSPREGGELAHALRLLERALDERAALALQVDDWRAEAEELRRDRDAALADLARLKGSTAAALVHRDLKPANVVVLPGGRVSPEKPSDPEPASAPRPTEPARFLRELTPDEEKLVREERLAEAKDDGETLKKPHRVVELALEDCRTKRGKLEGYVDRAARRREREAAKKKEADERAALIAERQAREIDFRALPADAFAKAREDERARDDPAFRKLREEARERELQRVRESVGA